MKITKKIAAFFTVLLFTLSMTAISFAQENGVDWNKGVIRATGLAAGKSSTKNPGLRRAQAKRAAIMDAQRNLAATVSGVQVSAESSMKDLELQYDVVSTRVNAIIKNMTEVSVQYHSDGTCEVVLEMPLFGAKNALASAAFLPFKDEPKMPFPQPVNAAATQASAGNAYTGLVIDCRGMDVNCVMSPVIKNANGQKIYGHQNLDYDKIIVNGMASYADDTDDEISRGRAGNNPLVIKAERLDDFNANPVISVADADKILAANSQGRFLDNCAVVFVK